MLGKRMSIKAPIPCGKKRRVEKYDMSLLMTDNIYIQITFEPIFYTSILKII